METKTNKVLVGYYDVPEFGIDSVETPLEGKPAEQYSRLNMAIQKRHSKLPRGTVIRRIGSAIEERTDENQFIELAPGMTLAQLFASEDDGKPEASRTIGRVFFNGSPMQIVLLFSRSGSYVSLMLNPVLRQDGVIRFSNRLNPMRLAAELPRLVVDILGGDARGLKLNIREKI